MLGPCEAVSNKQQCKSCGIAEKKWRSYSHLFHLHPCSTSNLLLAKSAFDRAVQAANDLTRSVKHHQPSFKPPSEHRLVCIPLWFDMSRLWTGWGFCWIALGSRGSNPLEKRAIDDPNILPFQVPNDFLTDHLSTCCCGHRVWSKQAVLYMRCI